jgi:hypothetical protein
MAATASLLLHNIKDPFIPNIKLFLALKLSKKIEPKNVLQLALDGGVV